MKRLITDWWKSLSPGARISFVILLLAAAASAYALTEFGSVEKAKVKIEERVASGKPIPYHYHFPIWGPRACLINLGLGLLGAGLVGWWGRRDRAPSGDRSGIGPLGNAAFLSALLAVLVAALLNAPRLRMSFWGDEQATVKHFIAGYYDYDEAGQHRWRPVTWKEVIHKYKTTNNHILFSLAAKVSHTLLHRPSDDPNDSYFTEWIIRLPTFLAGLLALPALAWAVHGLGFHRAAVWAPWLMVGHAWFTRFSTDARGYGFCILFVTLALGVAVRALEAGRWRHWAALGALSFAILYTYPGALFYVVLFHLAVLLALVTRAGADRIPQIGRWVIPQFLAGMLFLLLFLPCLPQMLEYMERIFASEEGLKLSWIIDELALLAAGDTWFRWEPENPYAVALAEQLSAHPLRIGLGLAAVVGAFVLGLVRVLREKRARLLVSALLLAGPLIVLHAMLEERFIYSWYLVPSLPIVVICLAVGVDALCARLPRPGLRPILGALVVLLIWQPAGLRNRLLRTVPMEPIRDTVALYRAVRNPDHPDFGKEVLSAHVHMFAETYDPAGYRVKNEAGLLDLMAQSEATGRPLYVNISLPDLGRLTSPEIWRHFDDPEKFAVSPHYWGLWGPCTRQIYRYPAR